MQVQEAQSLKPDGYKEAHAKTQHNQNAKAKDKERLLKAAREKQRVTFKGDPIRLSADFSKKTLQARRDWQELFKVMKSKDLQPTLPSKTIIQNGRADKVLPRH